MNVKITLGVIIMITLGTTIGIGTTGFLQQAEAVKTATIAPNAITGDNVYVA